MSRFWLVGLVALGSAFSAHAAIPGFVEEFDMGTGGFIGGSNYAQIASGGITGAGDAYLEISEPSPQQLGGFSDQIEYNGDLLGDGVTGFSLWLSDTGADDDLEIHIAIGQRLQNVWQYTVPFVPPDNGWAEFTVDLSDTANWVQIIGSGTLENALSASNRFLIRHDLAPYGQVPDAIAGEFGVDRITVLPEPASLALVAFGLTALIRRRRSA